MIVDELARIIPPYTLLRFSGFYSLGWFRFSIERSWRLGDPSMHGGGAIVIEWQGEMRGCQYGGDYLGHPGDCVTLSVCIWSAVNIVSLLCEF